MVALGSITVAMLRMLLWCALVRRVWLGEGGGEGQGGQEGKREGRNKEIEERGKVTYHQLQCHFFVQTQKSAALTGQ